VLARIWRDAGRDVVLENPAVNGFATDELIREELPLVRTFRPNIITLLIGANDIVRGSSERRYRDQLARIHAAIVVDGASTRVVALPQPDWSLAPAGSAFGDAAGLSRTIERFNGIAHEEAERAAARWIDLFPLMREQGRRRMFASDGLHPSAEAFAEWARELADALER
jgi:lysophospholipase L1-like esterase